MAPCPKNKAGIQNQGDAIIIRNRFPLRYNNQFFSDFNGLIVFTPVVFPVTVLYSGALGLSVKYGLFFALILLPVAALREVLGAGSFAGVEITALNDVRIPVFIQSAGGFMALACAAAVLNHKNGKTNVTAWFSEWTDSFTEKSPEGEEGSLQALRN